MATKTITTCDRCGMEIPDVGLGPGIVVVTGTQIGVEGAEDFHEGVDLCGECCRKELQRLVGEWVPQAAALWIKAMREPGRTSGARRG